MEIEIAGSYPIILDGETAGEITVSREGLFWSFEANCEMRSEIVRLSVYGDGLEGYLGIMEPFGDMLRLTKKFSRSALNEFPINITHAGQKGELENSYTESCVKAEPAEASNYRGEFPLSYYNKDKSALPSPLEAIYLPDVELLSPHNNFFELDWRPCPLPCSLFSGIKEKKFCSFITGSYIATDGETQFLAVPEDVAQTLPEESAIHFIDKIIISNSIYLICKIQQGKSVSEL